MNGPPVLLGTVLALLLAERAAELALTRRNARRLAARGAVWTQHDGLALIVAAQVVLLAGVAVEGTFAAWAGPRAWTWPCLVGLVLAQALRYWAIASLGDRWNVRVVTVPGEGRRLGGPYRWLRHPNYVAVLAEAVLLPLAFGAWATFLVGLPLKLVALARRIRIEDRALGPNA